MGRRYIKTVNTIGVKYIHSNPELYLDLLVLGVETPSRKRMNDVPNLQKLIGLRESLPKKLSFIHIRIKIGTSCISNKGSIERSTLFVAALTLSIASPVRFSTCSRNAHTLSKIRLFVSVLTKFLTIRSSRRSYA